MYFWTFFLIEVNGFVRLIIRSVDIMNSQHSPAKNENCVKNEMVRQSALSKSLDEFDALVALAIVTIVNPTFARVR